MREILFRGKRIDNGEWVEGSLLKVTINGKTAHLIFGDNFAFDGRDVKALSHALVAPETVCQYTGLTDKNGKKIFEGDIVKNGEHTMLVEWYKDNASFCLAFDVDGVYHETISFSDVYLEVIGNIHDNQELLED